MNQRLTDIRRAQLDQLLAGGGVTGKTDGDYTLMGAPRQDNEHKPYPKTERMNLGVKAVKSGLDKLNALLDQGPSVGSVVGNVVGAVPFVGPDLRKAMENSTVSIPYEFQRSATNPRVATGVNTAKVPTTDILDALKMSDLTGGTGASNLLGSVGKGYAPNPMDVLDALQLGSIGLGAAKAGTKGALTAARAGERMAEKAVPRIMERGGIGAEMLGALGQNTQSRAVKQKGGNWVESELKRGLGKIKQDESYPQSAIESAKEDLEAVKKDAEKSKDLGEQNIMLNTVAQLQRDIDHMEQTNAFNKWVDTKAGNYIRNQMATPDDPVLKMLDERAAKIKSDYQAGQKRLAKLDERIAQAEASASTTEERNNLANLKRTRAQRAAEIESDRELAMESMLPGGKDFSGYYYLKNVAETLINEREKAGFPIAGYGQSDPAKAWEATADLTTNINPASKFQGQSEKLAAAKAASKEYDKYVNVELPDRFSAYLKTLPLSDAEKQALRQSTPKTTMVEILGDRERSQALAKARNDSASEVNMAAFSMAEDNPYLAKLPPETPVYNALGMYDLGIDHIIDVLKDDVATGKIKLEDLNKITMDQAVKRAAEYDFEMAKKARDTVAQSRASMPVHKEYPEGYKWVQLTKPGEFNAESNAMGHSVRGYEPEKGHPDWTPESGDSGYYDYGHGGWEAIKSGQAKVYSLIDPSGKPHTTIEVMANPNPYPVSGEAFARLSPAEKAQFREHVMQWRRRNPDVEELTDENVVQALKEAGVPPQPDIITQIKGKGNARPQEKYDPYTQDFVKSGNWADVRDLRNTGLIEHSGKYFTEPEFVEAVKKYGRMGVQNTPWDVARQRHIEAGIPEEEALSNWVEAFKEGRGTLNIPDEPHMAGGGLLSKLGKAAKAARAAEELVPAAGRMKFADQPVSGLNIIKETGGNWLGGDVEKQLKKLQMGDTVPKQQMDELKSSIDTAKRVTGRDATVDRAIRQMENELDVQARNNALNAWMESNLTNYVKKQMGTADDPVRKLAEQDILHMEPYGTREAGSLVMRKRAGLGYPAQGVGESEKAKFWERLSDASIDPYPAGSYKHGSLDESILANNPWLQKVSDETMINSAKGLTRDLGFDHIVDVLRQDLREGRIRPEQLNKVSMEQAVRRTYEYDQEQAKKMREAAIKQTEGMPVHKEYPEGYKWLELALPKAKVPEGSTWEKYNGMHRLFGPNGESLSLGATKEEAIRVLNHEERMKKLEDALKYEGDTMGHCVGGYCPDVVQGRSRIYSLRDAKGEPHVTVEVKPTPKPDLNMSSEQYDKLLSDYSAAINRGEVDPNKVDPKSWYLSKGENLPPRIVQIKGKQNRAPKEEYLPFVQDFVRSGNWSEVGDLRNTGLIKRDGKYLTPAEESDELLRQLQPPPEEGMASGGSVGLKNALNNLLRTDKPEVHMAGGGAMAKAALKAAKAAKIEHPLVFPRAAAKSLEDIRPIAQRIAEQMTGEFVRQHPSPKVTTNPANKSRKQFEREQNIPMETRNLVPPADVPTLDYETKMGNVLLGVPGDPTLGGVLEAGSLENVAKPTVELTRVGDVIPEHPVPLFGGPRYGNENRFWASNYSAAVPIQNRADKLSELYESPVLGQYIKMAPDSANFALHNLDSLLAIQQPEKLPKGKMQALNKIIKAGSPKYGKFPGFAGFEDPADVLLQAQLNSNLRKHIAETLTKPTITDELGLPNGLDVVAAITYPELRNMEAGISGFSIGELRPKSNLKMSLSEHPTYDTNIPGALIGQSKYPVPSEIAFPDTTAYARSQMTPGVQEFNMLKMLGPRERIDQQYIDEIKMYEELMKQYTGKKKGGLAQSSKPKKVARHGNTVPH